ncbi:MAG: lysophospholipid acyltransferase family protein [Geminicoccaceae bacterium]
MILAWNGFALLLNLLPGGARTERFGQRYLMRGCRWLLAMMAGLGVAEFDLDALNGLRSEPGLILTPNHPTLLDVVLIASRLPRVVCITKAALWDSMLFGSVIRLAGYIRNDATVALVKGAVERLHRGQQLLLFPEGTRTVQRPVGPIMGGFALIASEAQAPVQIIVIEASSTFLGKGVSLFRMPSLPLRYRITLGPRLPAGTPRRDLPTTLDDYFRTRLPT